jgi:DNA adenine methylase
VPHRAPLPMCDKETRLNRVFHKGIAIIVIFDDDDVMRYPGGKGKCFHQIVNLMPPHHTYIEAYLGGGAVLRNKRPAGRTIGIEIDPQVVDQWRQEQRCAVEVVHADAVGYLRRYDFDGGELVYLDPPYVPATRLRKRVYRYDYTEEQHSELLATIKTIPCMVMISGYDNTMYDQHLAGWSKTRFQANSQSGLREECVWYNFARPTVLHDSTYVGQNFRERQSLKRKTERLHERIERMDPVERQELMTWMNAKFGGARAA